jgi:YD repeat-containing protein
VRSSKVPGFNIRSLRRTLATLWILFAAGICVGWPQDSASNPKMLARYLEFLPLAESPLSHVRSDSKASVFEVCLAPSVQGINILQTARTQRFLLAGFPVDEIDPTSAVPPERTIDAFDGGCPNSSAWGQTATLLPDGSLLLVGGLGQTGPVTTAFTETPGSNRPTRLETVLNVPRAWHTSTLLPDGNVLVLGGLDSAKRVVTTPELFDPSASTFNLLRIPGPTPRAYHTATVLTDGTVLIAGGLSSDGVLLSNAELWDPRTGIRTNIPAKLSVPRRNHCAVLLLNGKVLLWGGTDASGENLNNGDLYDPEAQSFTLVDTFPVEAQASGEAPLLVASRPENGAENVPLRGLLALRFSERLSVGTVNSNTVSLNGPQGRTPTKVVPAEWGILAFIAPDQPLLPDTSYSLLLDGLTDAVNRRLPTTQIVFTTVSAPTEANSDAGISDGGSASSGTQDSSSRDLKPLQAPSGVTAIAGQVLQLNGQPLAHVTIRLDGTSEQTETDSTGRFLLILGGNAVGGHRQIVIDGKTASNGALKTYGLFEYGMNVQSGVTNLLPFIIWMPVLDTAHAVTIPVPTKKETVVTTPLLPGLELHIPAGTVIRDYYGQTVHQITITPIPVNQPPFPLPNVPVPIYFTIQPGGAWLTQVSASGPQGAQLYYPNTYHKPVGTVFQFWNYNPDGQGWYIYGLGRVAPGGLEVVPDPGVLIYGFSGAMVGDSGAPPNGPPPGNDDGSGGEPVDLSTGLFTYTHTDLALPDLIPLTLTRTYRPNDPTSRAFGIGTSHPYDIFLITPNGDADIYLILQDGGRIHFVKSGSIWVCNSSPTSFDGATLTYNNGWFIKKKDGTVLSFPISEGASTPQQEAIIGLRDRYGNALTFTRDNNSNLTQITSPNGRYIQFTLDSGGRITQATDSAGRVVSYAYDGSGRLITVTDAKGGITTYTYDGSSSNMLTVKDPRGVVYLTNQYDSNNRVIKQTLADSSTFQFAYIVDGQNNVTQATLTDQRGYIRQTAFNSSGYTLTNTLAVGTPQQQVTTYNRDPSTNLVSSVTDALSRTTAYAYDTLGNTLSITRLYGTPDAVTTSYTYEPAFSQVASVTDPLGHVTNLTYDSVGNPITLTDPLNHQWTFTYDSQGRPLSSTDPLSDIFRFSYYGGDLVSVTDPLARTVNLNRDDAGRLIGRQDPLGAVTLYQYDSLDKLIRTSDPLGNTTSFTYDADRDLVILTDALNHATNYTYDSLDRLLRRQDPLGHVESYIYDPAGNVFTFTDRKGQQRTFIYDPLNRRTNTTYADSTSISYAYDAGNRLTQAVDSSAGTITRSFDGLNRLTSEVTPKGIVSYTYDKASRRTSMTVGGQPTVNYSYDNANRLA